MRVTEGDHNTSTGRLRWLDANEVGADTVEQDARYFYHQILSTPCLDEVVESSGPWIVTASGRRLLDFHGNSLHQIGYAHPEVVRAVSEEIQRLPYCPRRYTNRHAVALAEQLVRSAPGDLRDNSRVLFTPSGSAAVGIAIKVARCITGRYKTLAFKDSFHGATLDAAAVGGQELFHRGMGPLMEGVFHVDPPDPVSCRRCRARRCSGACVDRVVNLIEEHGDFAALIAEPIRCTSVRLPSDEFWPRVREACDRTGTLLIFDEIPTCLGRTGTMWACEHTGVSPDLLVIGKGLGGGVMPMAGVIGRSEYNDRGLVPVRELAIGHYTHEKSPLASAAALATLRVIEQESLVLRSKTLGATWSAELWDSLRSVPGVVQVRSLGLMVAVELSTPDLADRAMYESINRGLSFKIGDQNNLILFPPLNIERAHLEEATRIVRDSIRAASSSK